MKKSCIIVAAGDFNGLNNNFTADFIIAADAGYDHLVKFGLNIDLLIGDLDSIADFETVCEKSKNIEILRFPSEKDESDLELAVAEALRRGFDCFYIYGGLGKRLDHTLANISVLASLARRGVTAWLIGEGEVVTAVTNGKITLSPGKSGIMSLFPMGGKASGISLDGFKYPLDNADLYDHSTRGLSNEFMGEIATVEVLDGTLIVILS
ncbi:MAG: thiamine diphosphokinase [Oscillospiraceae bacterium]|nr:thiamine diphosphokinase [Oscillospiraceae bacterium]